MKFYGELLVFLLLLLTNLRVFFVNHVRRDPLVALAPITFLLTILQIFSWGFDVFTTLGFIIGLLVFLSNFHAMFRYAERLYIDHYSPLMKTWALFTVLLSAAALVATIIFRPIELNPHKLGIEEKIYRYDGSFRSGFTPARFFSKADALLYDFSPATPLGQEKVQSKDLIIFIADKRGDTQSYKPYLQLLAKEGYQVYSADFYADDLRWFHTLEDNKFLRRIASIYRSIRNPQWYMSQREFYTYNIMQECKAILKIVDENYGPDKSFYLVTDEMGQTAIVDFKKRNSDRIKGTLTLNTISTYKTPGYGCIEQTDPLLSLFFKLPRDKDLKAPKAMVESTLAITKSKSTE
ncbi:MAG: hypothetical protein K6C97_01135 [Treponema sp.]|nr:hypothetical protein [Treponema sp.]